MYICFILYLLFYEDGMTVGLYNIFLLCCIILLFVVVVFVCSPAQEHGLFPEFARPHERHPLCHFLRFPEKHLWVTLGGEMFVS